MRRQGHYVVSGGNPYMATQLQAQHEQQDQQQQQQQDHFQGRLEAFTPEREQRPYATSRTDEQWRWSSDDNKKIRNSQPSHMFPEGVSRFSNSQGQEVDASRSYFQGARPEQLGFDIQGNRDHRSQSYEEDMQLGFKDKPMVYAVESLELQFVDDIIKLAKEQNDAEDAENARHTERINTINNQYHEQLVVLRGRHASSRDEFLRQESNARQHQYQQALMEHFPNSGLGAVDPHYGGGAGAAPPVNEAHQPYNANHFPSHRDQSRYHGGVRDHRFDSRGPYPGGRGYDSGPRHY